MLLVIHYKITYWVLHWRNVWVNVFFLPGTSCLPFISVGHENNWQTLETLLIFVIDHRVSMLLFFFIKAVLLLWGECRGYTHELLQHYETYETTKTNECRLYVHGDQLHNSSEFQGLPIDFNTIQKSMETNGCLEGWNNAWFAVKEVNKHKWPLEGNDKWYMLCCA